MAETKFDGNGAAQKMQEMMQLEKLAAYAERRSRVSVLGGQTVGHMLRLHTQAPRRAAHTANLQHECCLAPNWRLSLVPSCLSRAAKSKAGLLGSCTAIR